MTQRWGRQTGRQTVTVKFSVMLLSPKCVSRSHTSNLPLDRSSGTFSSPLSFRPVSTNTKLGMRSAGDGTASLSAVVQYVKSRWECGKAASWAEILPHLASDCSVTGGLGCCWPPSLQEPHWMHWMDRAHDTIARIYILSPPRASSSSLRCNLGLPLLATVNSLRCCRGGWETHELLYNDTWACGQKKTHKCTTRM